MASTYSIELLFEFDTTVSFRKILDFKDRSADPGLYNQDGSLRFYPFSIAATGGLIANTLSRVVLTRDDTTDNVTGYVDGVQKFSFVDFTGLAVFSGPNQIIWFFTDDLTVPGEASGGTVDLIRIYDTALTSDEVSALDGPEVPEPSSFALFALGSLGLAIVRRRMRA